MSSGSFLIHLQFFRTNFKADNFSELALLNYCCLIIQYMEFLFDKIFVIFDRLSIKHNFIVQAEVRVIFN